ncbi:MAG: toxin-antitoxin system TumE family protein [Promethearchaeota archaeon]
MSDHILLLQRARKILINLLDIEIILEELDYHLSQLKIILKSGITIYIKYNEFEEYGYQIVFSPQKNDFSRFDNFDDRWNVSTKPHHFHDKNKNRVIESPMIGEPEHDMPILVNYIKNRNIFS